MKTMITAAVFALAFGVTAAYAEDYSFKDPTVYRYAITLTQEKPDNQDSLLLKASLSGLGSNLLPLVNTSEMTYLEACDPTTMPLKLIPGKITTGLVVYIKRDEVGNSDLTDVSWDYSHLDKLETFQAIDCSVQLPTVTGFKGSKRIRFLDNQSMELQQDGGYLLKIQRLD